MTLPDRRSVRLSFSDGLLAAHSAPRRFAELLRRADLSVELYAPMDEDPQGVHDRDELYFIARGRGRFFDGEQDHEFGPGDAFFVPAGMEHRFTSFANDLVAWVVFCGPLGGRGGMPRPHVSSAGFDMELVEPYRPRRIGALSPLRTEDWRLKVYEIVYDGPHASARLVREARRLVEESLRRLPTGPVDHKVGFVGVHDGRGADFVFIALWTNENEQRHVAWMTPDKDPANLAPVERGYPDTCVWDLALMAAERDSWVRHVLANPRGPDVEAYLRDEADLNV